MEQRQQHEEEEEESSEVRQLSSIRSRSEPDLECSSAAPILIVDDEPMNILVLGTLIQQEKLDFDRAISGRQAVDMVS